MKVRVTLLAIISELVLWGALLTLLVCVVPLIAPRVGIRFVPHHGEEITLRFKDVSQLAVGSPVHFMGTDIGYVTQVKPDGNRVKVRFETYPEAVKIPHGARFTVQFNGLAGAKTLEILPPKERRRHTAARPSKPYIVEEPIRLKDVINTQMVLAEALEYNSNNVADALGDIKNGPALMHRLDAANQQVHGIYRTIRYADEVVHDQANRIHVTLQNATHSAESFAQIFQGLKTVTNPAFFKTNTMATLRYLTFATEDTYHALQKAEQELSIQDARHRIAGINQGLEQRHRNLQQRLPQAINGFVGMNNALFTADASLKRLECAMIAAHKKQVIKAWFHKTQEWARLSKQLPQ